MDVIEAPLAFNLPFVTTAVERAARITTEAAQTKTSEMDTDSSGSVSENATSFLTKLMTKNTGILSKTI